MVIMIRIRELRKQRKLTAKKLGEIMNVAESTISLYENGKREPDYNTLNKLADYFDVTVDYLLGRDEKKPSDEKDEELDPNTLIIRGRDGSYVKRQLSDEQVKAMKAIIDQLPDVPDDL